MEFHPDLIRDRDYREASLSFIEMTGMTPRDYIADDFDGEPTDPTILSLARFLDQWDLWLYTEE